MRIISKIIALTALLVFTIGCRAQDPTFKKYLTPEQAAEPTTTTTLEGEESVDKADVEDEEDNSILIKLGDLTVDKLDISLKGQRNSLELATSLRKALERDLVKEELSKDFDATTIDVIWRTLLFVEFDSYNWTVGIGENNNSQSEVLTLRTDNNINNVLDLIFHTNSNNEVSLVDILYIIDYYKHHDTNYDSYDGERVCYNNQSVKVECGPKTNVIKSLTAVEYTNNNVVVDWSVAHDKIKKFELEILDDEGSVIYKASGAARNFLLLELNPSTSYVICLRALVGNVWSEYITIRHKTKR